MHQVLSTQSSPGNQTSLYALSLAVDHLDAISEVISIQSQRSLFQSKTSLLVFDHYVHMHATIICSASDTHHYYMLRVQYASYISIIICFASDTHLVSSSMWPRHRVSPHTSNDASRARRRFISSSRSRVFSSSPGMFHSTEIPEQCIAGSPAMFHSTSLF